MARFNLNEYETVDERLRRFKKDWPDSQIATEYDTDGQIGKSRWVVKTYIWKERGYDRADATGLAYEIDGTPGANQTAALENCETSSLGRALANLGYSGNKRATREEMQKVQREEQRQAEEAQARKSWLSAQANKLLEAEKAGNFDSIRRVHAWAQGQGDVELTQMAESTLERMDKAVAEGRLASPESAQEAVQQELGGAVVEGEVVE